MQKRLRPAVPDDLLYPADAAFMARTTLYETRMLGFTALQLDTVTTMVAGLVNGRAAVRHAAGAGDEVFELYRSAGLLVEEDTLVYRSYEEAESCADRLIAQGKRLFGPYPLPEGRYPESGFIVPPSLYQYLNAKENLETIVPAENLPGRKILSHDELGAFSIDKPVFLKAAGDAATGWGFAVHPCPDQVSLDAARNWFQAHRDAISSVIVEEAVPVVRCWCAGVAIGDTRTTCFGGAEQLFDSPARQVGSIVDPAASFPGAAVDLAETVAEAARKLGYRGIAGLDIGLSRDGTLVVFDPNFRINASTSQLMLHRSAAARSGLPCSRSFQVNVGGPFSQLSDRLSGPIQEGWFVPTRLFNGEKHPLAAGKHIVTGFVLGAHRAAAEATAQLLEGILQAT